MASCGAEVRLRSVHHALPQDIKTHSMQSGFEYHGWQHAGGNSAAEQLDLQFSAASLQSATNSHGSIQFGAAATQLPPPMPQTAALFTFDSADASALPGFTACGGMLVESGPDDELRVWDRQYASLPANAAHQVR